MKRSTLLLVVLSLLLGGVGQASAGQITVGFPEANGQYYTSGFPLAPVAVATENYSVPSGEVISSATLSGTFGSTSQFYGSTAEFNLLLNGTKVGSTYDVTPDPFNNVVPFSFTITDPGVLASLESGSATLSYVQESPYVVRLSATSLVMNTTASAVPEPASLTLLGLGAVGLLGYARRRRLAVAA